MTLPLFSSLDMSMLETSASLLRQQGFAGWHQTQTQGFRALRPAARRYSAFRERTARAQLPLHSMSDLLTYNALYSARHFTLFQRLLNEVERGTKAAVTRLRIVDHGCGQGLASLALLDRLQAHQLDVDLYLVEPSAYALHAAHGYVTAFAGRMQGQVRVHPVCAWLGDEPEHIFKNQIYTIHLFSNVLDLVGQRPFNLHGLCSKIARASGRHLLLAASPCYKAGEQGFRQLMNALPTAEVRLNSFQLTARIADDYDLADCKGGQSYKRRVTGQALALLLDNRHG